MELLHTLSRWFSLPLAVRRDEMELMYIAVLLWILDNQQGSFSFGASADLQELSKKCSRDRWLNDNSNYCKYCVIHNLMTLLEGLGMHVHAPKRVSKCFSPSLAVICVRCTTFISIMSPNECWKQIINTCVQNIQLQPNFLGTCWVHYWTLRMLFGSWA